MTKRPLGKTGIQVPPVVFGTSALGNLYQALPTSTKTAIVGEIFKQVPPPAVLDTAGKYGAGLALESIGESLRKLNVPPEQVFISNKLGWIRVPLKTPEPTFEPGAWVDLEYDAEQRISYEGILDCWRQGNELLGAPYEAQLVSVHDPDEYLAAAETPEDRLRRFSDVVSAYRALNELKADGKVQAVGVGSKDWQVIQELDSAVELDWVMIANSFTIMRHPPELIAFMASLADKGVGIVNSAVFHGGFLVGSNQFDYHVVDPASAAGASLFRWRDTFNALCAKHNVKPAHACVQFGISAPGIAALAMNTHSPERIADNLALATTSVTAAFWQAAREQGLIAADYRSV